MLQSQPMATPWTCTAAACTPRGDDGAAFTQAVRSLQELLNLFGGSAGFSRLTVDGQLGPQTVTAYNLTDNWILRRENVANGGTVTNTPFTMAQNISTYDGLAILRDAAARFQPLPAPADVVVRGRTVLDFAKAHPLYIVGAIGLVAATAFALKRARA